MQTNQSSSLTSGKEPICQCRRSKRWGLDPRSGRSSGGGHGNPAQYSCLENPHGQRSLSSVQSLSRVRLFVTPRIAAHQVSLSITNSRSPPKPMSIKLLMPSNHLILCRLLLLLPSIQSFPASGSFPVSQFFASGGQILEL